MTSCCGSCGACGTRNAAGANPPAGCGVGTGAGVNVIVMVIRPNATKWWPPSVTISPTKQIVLEMVSDGGTGG